MHTYELELGLLYSVWMASAILRDTIDKPKVMYTEMTARLIVYLRSLLRSLLELNHPPPWKNSQRGRGPPLPFDQMYTYRRSTYLFCGYVYRSKLLVW
jgi:hypothetical protein